MEAVDALMAHLDELLGEGEATRADCEDLLDESDAIYAKYGDLMGVETVH